MITIMAACCQTGPSPPTPTSTTAAGTPHSQIKTSPRLCDVYNPPSKAYIGILRLVSRHIVYILCISYFTVIDMTEQKIINDFKVLLFTVKVNMLILIISVVRSIVPKSFFDIYLSILIRRVALNIRLCLLIQWSTAGIPTCNLFSTFSTLINWNLYNLDKMDILALRFCCRSTNRFISNGSPANVSRYWA